MLTAYDRMQARATDYCYARCATCGLLALRPMPSDGDIAAFYPQDYYQRIETRERNLDKPVNRWAIRYFYGVDSVAQPRWLRAGFRLLARRILRGMREPCGDNRLLDVGCGGGGTLATYRHLGWAVRGVEPSPQAVARCRARGLAVHQGTVFDAPFGREFDVVLLSHVIEHVREPVATLARAGQFLAPGGTVLVATPNARALGFALYRSCWFPLDAPRHLHLFDPHTLRLLGQRAGLAVHKVATRAEPSTLCASRHYTATQGQVLPANLAERTAIIERSWRQWPRARLSRALLTPLAVMAALAGRGDVLEAEFTLHTRQMA